AGSSVASTAMGFFGQTPLGLGSSGDQIFIFQAASVNVSNGAVTSPVVLSGWSNTTWLTGTTTTPAKNTSYLPAGLVNGAVTYAANFSGTPADNHYNCATTSGTKANLLAAIYNGALSSANWTTGALSFPQCSFFTVTTPTPTKTPTN